MPQFLYQIRPTRPEMLTEGLTPREDEVISQHCAYVKDLTDRGVIILVGRTQTTDASTFGIAIFNADSEQAARAIMNDDPAVKHGVMSATLFPYRVALIFRGQCPLAPPCQSCFSAIQRAAPGRSARPDRPRRAPPRAAARPVR